jgi:hypothetical protein
VGDRVDGEGVAVANLRAGARGAGGCGAGDDQMKDPEDPMWLMAEQGLEDLENWTP